MQLILVWLEFLLVAGTIAVAGYVLAVNGDIIARRPIWAVPGLVSP